jgi:hypothetical protein
LAECCDAVKEHTLCNGPSVEVKNGECVGRVVPSVLERIASLEEQVRALLPSLIDDKIADNQAKVDDEIAAVERELELAEEEADERFASHNASFVGLKEETNTEFGKVNPPWQSTRNNWRR